MVHGESNLEVISETTKEDTDQDCIISEAENIMGRVQNPKSQQQQTQVERYVPGTNNVGAQKITRKLNTQKKRQLYWLQLSRKSLQNGTLWKLIQ